MPKNKAEKNELIGDLAACFSIISYIPIAYYLSVTGVSTSVTIPWIIFTLTSAVLWFIYGHTNKNLPTTITGLSIALLVLYIILAKIYLTMVGR